MSKRGSMERMGNDRGSGDFRADPGDGSGARPVQEIVLVRGGRHVLIADIAGAGIASALEPLLGPWPPLPGDLGAPDVRYVVDPWQSRWGASGVRVTRDGALRYLGSIEGAALWLRRDVEEDVARNSGAGVVVDAAAVVWRERAILIAGQGRTGTSSLAAELVRLGAAPWSDAVVVLDGEGRVHAGGGSTAASAPLVAMVVSTTYRPEVSWEPRRLRGSRAVLPIVDSARRGGDGAARVLRVAARLAASVLTLEGARAEASLAAPRILAALDEWLDAVGEVRPRGGARRGALSRAQQAIFAARTRRRRAV